MFRLDLSYKDNLAGEVAIESDADLELALQSFIEKESVLNCVCTI